MQLEALQCRVDGAKWRLPEHFHITLRFFGEMDESRATELDRELASIRIPAFPYTITGAGWTGGNRPQSLWLGVDGGPALKQMAQECEHAAQKVGLPAAPCRYTPHLTMAYCKNTPPNAANIFVQRSNLTHIGPLTADRFHLYSSWLGKHKSTYIEEAEYPLLARTEHTLSPQRPHT